MIDLTRIEFVYFIFVGTIRTQYFVAIRALILISHSKKLSKARRSEGLTQADVALKSGLTQQAVSRIETGSGWTIASLLRYLSGMGYEVNLSKIAP